MKDLVCYMVSNKLFTKKKDSEGYTCLRTIKELHEKGFIDDYFFSDKERIKEHLQKRNDYQNNPKASDKKLAGKILISNYFI